jgi:O-antigen ligase
MTSSSAAWAWTSSSVWRAPLALGALGTLVALVLTFSRAGLAAATAGLAVMAGLCAVRGERRLLLTLGAATLLVPAVLVWATSTDPRLDHRWAAELDHVGSTVESHSSSSEPTERADRAPSRIEFWYAATNMLRDHPLLGVGPDNFRYRFGDYSGVTADNLGIHAHNQYLEALANAGVLGGFTLCWLLLRLMRVALGVASTSTASADWPWRAATVASLTAWLLHALLDDFERFWPASVAFWLLAGLVAVGFPDAQRVQRRQQAFGRIALAYKHTHTRPQRITSLLGPPAQRKQLTCRLGDSQALQHATRLQAGQIPVQQHDGGLTQADLVDEPVGSGAVAHD